MKRFTSPLLLILFLQGIALGQNGQRPTIQPGFYLELGSCTACGAYGNRIVQLLKQNGVSAFNGYSECSGSCFSPGQYAMASRINRSRTQGSEVGVMAGPFPTADSAMAVLRRLRSLLKPVFDEWNEGWPNSSLTHDNGNAYNIQPLSIWLVKFGNAAAFASTTSPVSSGALYTPERNSIERKGIMDALRTNVESVRGLRGSIVFTVRTLSVQNGWAFIVASPQSSDGQELIEFQAWCEFDQDVIALLRRRGNRWQVVERDVCPSDVSYGDWGRRHGAPRAIFGPK